MIFASGTCLRDAFDDPFRRFDRPALKFARRQHAGPGIEDLQHVGAGLELAKEILNRVLDNGVDDLRKRFGVTIRHHPRRRLIRRAVARDHVGRNRPWRAAEADQRDFRIEFAAHAAQRFEHWFEFTEVAGRRQRADLVGCVERVEPRAFADFETHITAERVGNDQDIGEDDGGVEVEAADRLQRYFGGEVRREAQVEKAAGLGADFTVFRQIAAGLAHHPDRRDGLPAAGKHLKERFDGQGLCQADVSVTGRQL